MTKASKKPVSIQAAREEEGARLAATAAIQARVAAAQQQAALAAAQGEPVEPGMEDVVPYTMGDLFAALGESNWALQLANRQIQTLRQQLATYKNLVKDLEGKLAATKS